jgi:hypothetical protein
MPERLYRLRDELLDRGGVADVGRNHDRTAPVARELVRERPERGLIAGSKGHRGPRALNARAVSAPIPRLAPVMMATFPARRSDEPTCAIAATVTRSRGERR